MLTKITNTNFSRLACALSLAACFVGSTVFAMDDEEKDLRTRISRMSREQLEELVLQQQGLLKGMSETEKKVEQVLNTTLSKSVV